MRFLFASAAVALLATGFVMPFAPAFDLLFRTRTPVLSAAEDSVVVITGVSSGLGKDAAETLAARGYTVLGTVRQTGAKVAPGIKPVVVDVTDAAGVERLKSAVQRERKEGKALLALINNAGTSTKVPLEHWLAPRARCAALLQLL